MARFLTKIVDGLSEELISVVALTMLGAGVVIAIVVSRMRARQTTPEGRVQAAPLHAQINAPRAGMVH